MANEDMLISESVNEERFKGAFRHIPVVPSIITINKPQGVRKDIIINLGEVTDIGVRRPSMISFKSFFPVLKDTFVNPKADISIEPLDWVKYFEGIENSVILFGITGLEIRGDYILDDFMYKRVGGVGDDIEYSVRFISHVPVDIRRADLASQPGVSVLNPFISRGISTASSIEIGRHESWVTAGRKMGINPHDLLAINNRINLYNLHPGDSIYGYLADGYYT